MEDLVVRIGDYRRVVVSRQRQRLNLGGRIFQLDLLATRTDSFLRFLHHKKIWLAILN